MREIDIPITVLVPPDGLSKQKENRWHDKNRQDIGDTWILESVEQINVDNDLKRAYRRSYCWNLNDAINDGQRQADSLAEGRQKDATKYGQSAKNSAEGARSILNTFRNYVNMLADDRREELWGDPEMPDLGLDFSAYEGIPEEAVRLWAKTQGIIEEPGLGQEDTA